MEPSLHHVDHASGIPGTQDSTDGCVYLLPNDYQLPPISLYHHLQGYFFDLTFPVEKINVGPGTSQEADGILIQYANQTSEIHTEKFNKFVPWNKLYQPVLIIRPERYAHVIPNHGNGQTVAIPFRNGTAYRFWPPVFPGQRVPSEYRVKCIGGKIEKSIVPEPRETWPTLCYPIPEIRNDIPGHVHEIKFPVHMVRVAANSEEFNGVMRSYQQQDIKAMFSPIHMWIKDTVEYGGPITVKITNAPLVFRVSLDEIIGSPDRSMLFRGIRSVGLEFQYYPIKLESQTIPHELLLQKNRINCTKPIRSYRISPDIAADVSVGNLIDFWVPYDDAQK